MRLKYMSDVKVENISHRLIEVDCASVMLT